MTKAHGLCRFLLLASVLLSAGGVGMISATPAVDIVVNDTALNFNTTLDENDLSPLGLPGEDFPTPVDSDADWKTATIYESIYGIPTGGDPGDWQVEISRTDVDWDPSIVLYVRRSSDGTSGSGGSVDAGSGTTYQEVTTTATLFFTGSGTVQNIGLQFRYQGVSVDTGPPGTYSTTVTYAVSNR